MEDGTCSVTGETLHVTSEGTPVQAVVMYPCGHPALLVAVLRNPLVCPKCRPPSEDFGCQAFRRTPHSHPATQLAIDTTSVGAATTSRWGLQALSSLFGAKENPRMLIEKRTPVDALVKMRLVAADFANYGLMLHTFLEHGYTLNDLQKLKCTKNTALHALAPTVEDFRRTDLMDWANVFDLSLEDLIPVVSDIEGLASISPHIDAIHRISASFMPKRWTGLRGFQLTKQNMHMLRFRPKEWKMLGLDVDDAIRILDIRSSDFGELTWTEREVRETWRADADRFFSK